MLEFASLKPHFRLMMFLYSEDLSRANFRLGLDRITICFLPF